MKARKAWVVSILANYQTRVVGLLPPNWGTDRVESHLEYLHSVMCLSLEEQAATFRTKNPFKANPATRNSDKLVTVIAVSGAMILAQRSVIREIVDTDDKQSIRFQPEAFKVWKLKHDTLQPYVADEVKPPEVTCPVVDLRLDTLLPKRRRT